LPQKQLKVVAAKPMSFHIGVPKKKEAAEAASFINPSKKALPNLLATVRYWT